MIRATLLLAATLPLLADNPTEPDLLRLTNGELEGRFGGIDQSGILRWERDDGIAPMEFKTDKVRQIVLRGGHPVDPGKNAAHLELVNGDRIPAHVVSLDSENITVDTSMAGRLVVPRDAVRHISPNPFGGRLIYAGPFSEKGWEIYSPADDFPEEEQEEDGDAEEEDGDKKEAEPSWRQSGSKWYFTGGREALRNAVDMPDTSIFRFTLEWRSRPPISIAFHADFADPVYPEPEEGEKELTPEEQEELDNERIDRRRNSHHLADHFGNAYVLTLRNSYATLQHSGFNDKGEPFAKPVSSSSSNIRFEDTGSANFEIRCDRVKGSIALFVNGEFSMQWKIKPKDGPDDSGNGYAAPGNGIGFQMQGSDVPIRISDIVIAEWNGMPDSARSLQSDEFDVVLLTNGTDRFSGKVSSIDDGKLQLEGRYAPLEIPTAEIAEVHFARKDLQTPEETRDRQTRTHFQPVGRLSGVAGKTADNKMNLRSPLLGELELDLTSAVVIEFQSGSSFLNYWEDEL